MARPPCALIVLTCLASLGSACAFQDEDATIPGDHLGTFRVEARMASSTCGPDALGSPANWDFDVELSQDRTEFYWLNGETPVQGSIASDGVSFTIETQTVVPLEEPTDFTPGCSIRRLDRTIGELDEPSETEGLSGQLSYDFAPVQGSDCAAYVGVAGGFTALPCTISYDFTAKRTAAPPGDEE